MDIDFGAMLADAIPLALANVGAMFLDIAVQNPWLVVLFGAIIVASLYLQLAPRRRRRG